MLITAFLREGEAQKVQDVFRKHFQINLRFVRAKNLFLRRLKGIEDPEKKRKIIGRTFIEVFEKEAGRIKRAEFLAQGTLYPDVIESRSAFGGPSAVIKSHHNVGGLPKKMHLYLVEPLKHLFKDEVRKLGKELGLPDDMAGGSLFRARAWPYESSVMLRKNDSSILRKADVILLEEIRTANLYQEALAIFCRSSAY